MSYDRFTSFGLDEALPVAAALVVLALIPLVVLRALRGEGREDTHPTSRFARPVE